MKLHGNSHVFPECLPSGLLRCSFIYLAVLGLRHCARAPLRCGEQGPCWLPCVGFSARWPLPLQSLGSRAGPSVAAARGLSRRGPWAQPSWPVGSGAQAEQGGAQAQELRCTWDRLGSGIEPAPPALTGRLSPTVLPGKSYPLVSQQEILMVCLLSARCCFRRQVPP